MLLDTIFKMAAEVTSSLMLQSFNLLAKLASYNPGLATTVLASP